MEFRKQEQKAVYNPAALQQSAFSRPLPSTSTSLLHVRAGGASSDAGNGMRSLVQKPTPISAAPAVQGGALSTGGMRLTSTTSTTTINAASTEADTASCYRECLRNHAASLGGHIVDGCCEFMPCSDDALKCAACGCHRSFHRKDTTAELTSSLCNFQNGGTHGRSVPLLLPPPRLPPHHHSHLKPFASSGVLLHTGNSAGANAGATESSSEELMAAPPQFILSKKRFRTKFTAEQKERMLGFAEKVGWRMQKQDEATVEQFCGEVGVSRQVLKVWMHNNKNSLRKQLPPQEEEEAEVQQHHEMPED